MSFQTNTTFNGVRVYALNRNSMVNGGSANAIGFSILPANLGDQYSLVPASFRTGDPPPAGQPEWFMDVNSSATAGTVETQVFVRRFHVDFVTPANSIFGVGATHSPDGIITVNGFKDAFNATTSHLCPNGTTNTTQRLDTLGDKIMYPLIYQNRGGTESIYADQTIIRAADTLTGPTAVRWYQFNMTGNTIPPTPAQQQDWNNGADGLFRWMPSINVDWQGNVAIGYSTSSTTLNPEIRYAGRLAGDPPNNMAQGEATLITSGGHQTSTSGRWGDYSTMFVDPTDGCTFWHVNEYYTATSSASWATRIGSFKFPGCAAPTPTLRPQQRYSNSYVYTYSDGHFNRLPQLQLRSRRQRLRDSHLLRPLQRPSRLRRQRHSRQRRQLRSRPRTLQRRLHRPLHLRLQLLLLSLPRQQQQQQPRLQQRYGYCYGDCDANGDTTNGHGNSENNPRWPHLLR